MQFVTNNFLRSVSTSTLRKKTLTVDIDGYVYPLQIESGTWGISTGSNVRRTADLIVRVPNSTFKQAVQDGGISRSYDILGTEGAIFDMKSGFNWGSQEELVPVVCGRASTLQESWPEGQFSLKINDFGADLAAQSFLTPLSQPATMTRVDAIKAIVDAAFPGISIVSTATDTGTLNTTQLWSGSPLDAVKSLATDAKAEAFFLPDRSFLIRDLPTLDADPVWTVATGPGGTAETYNRTRPLDKLYNRQRVLPGATDGSQPFTYGSAMISDPTSGRNPDRWGIGVRNAPDITSMTAATREEADEIAYATLMSKYFGSTETLDLGALANFALEGGDVIGVEVNPTSLYLSEKWKHLLDSLTCDVVTDSMSASTRSSNATE